MATTKPLLLKTKSPIKLVGLFFALLLSGCQIGKSPEEVTALFWQELAQGQVENARKQATQDTQQLVNIQDIEANSLVTIGDSESDEPMASVQTTILRNKKRTTFNTALLLENDLWKVDYSQTQMNIAMSPFGEILQNLENLGGFFTQQLVQQLPGMQKEMIQHLPQIQQEMERHLPQIQKDMQSLGDGLRKQIEQFGRALPQPNAQQLPNSKPNSF